MRIRMRLPVVKPDEYEIPTECPHEDCRGTQFKLHQAGCPKQVMDQGQKEVTAKRYRCLRCWRTFRVYPTGVSQAQRSNRLKAVGVMLYVLGLSYGGVEDALAALGWVGSKTSTYRDVQAAGEAVVRIRQAQSGRQVQVVGTDTTFVRCDGQQVTIAIGVDALSQSVLDIQLVDSESAENLRPFLNELVRTFEVEVILSDDLDSYKQVCDDLQVKHGICRAHVNRNVARLVEELAEQALKRPDPVPEGLDVSVDDFLADLEYAQQLVAFRPLTGCDQLQQLHRRYQTVPPPASGQQATMWYRLRQALLRWWNHWPRLTLDQVWRGPDQQRLDGTNNVSERVIGWWVKERYRTMRAYKRRQSVLNVSRLIAHLGATPDSPALAQLLTA